MNLVDLIIVVILIVAAIRGFIKGFFVEFASIAALVLGVLAAMTFSVYVRDWISGYVSWRPDSIRVVAFLLVFIAVVVLVHLIANIMEKFVRAIALGLISRLAGFVFGFIKMAFILSFFMYIIAQIEEYDVTIVPKEPKKTSKFYVPIEKLVPNILPFLKEDKGKKSNTDNVPA